MKARSRSKKFTQVAVKKTDLNRFEIIVVPNRMPIQQAGKLIEDTLNRALVEKRQVERQEWHPGGAMYLMRPRETAEEEGVNMANFPPGFPPGLAAVITNLGGAKAVDGREEHRWAHFMNRILKSMNAAGISDLKKAVPPAVQSLIKTEQLSMDAIKEYISLCEKHGKDHTCEEPACALKDASVLAIEAMQTFLKENLQ